MRSLAPLCCLLLLAPLSRAQSEENYWEILRADRMAFRMRTVAMLPEGNGQGIQMVYGDNYSFVRVVQLGDGAAREVWRSRTLDGLVLEVLVEDLDGDNRAEIIARTQNGKLYVFDEQYNMRYESQSGEYSSIEAMAVANMDADVAYEIVLLSEGFVIFIDGSSFQREFRSNLPFRGTDMAIGNVDTDPQLEIVLNAGYVLDSERAESKWRAPQFGSIIELLDIDGDGLLEIVAWTEGQPMKIFDADEQQEKPLR